MSLTLNQFYSALSGRGIGGGTVAPINTPPTNNAGSGGSGGSTGGTVGMPAWRQGKIDRTWMTIPASNKLADLDPANNPAMNPNYPNSPEWRGVDGQIGLVGAWCGACYDELTGTFHIPLGGGHTDYGGNEPYKIKLSDDTPQWKMLRPPSGAIGNLLTTNDGKEATGLYSDGRVRSSHTYNNFVYVPGYGPLLHRLGAVYYSGQTGLDSSFLFNESTGESKKVFDINTTTFNLSWGNLGYYYGAACWDTSRNVVWFVGTGTSYFAKLIPGTTWSGQVVGAYDSMAQNYAKMEYVPEMDLVLLATGGANPFNVFDPKTGVRTTATISGTFPTGFSWGNGNLGMAWCHKLGCVLLWNNSSNTTTIVTLTPGADWKTSPWTVGQLTLDPSNSVVPSAASPNGTYGRFGYSALLQGCYLLNSVNEPIYFFTIDS